MSSRRDFLKTLAGGAALAGFVTSPFELLAKHEIIRISVLHTNDVHSRIEPFPENDPKYPGLGGFARRAALIKKIRNTEPNILLLDAGDIFQGTPYFNLYGGELEFRLMSEMGYDAATIGNHDFDNGIDGLARQLKHANFPFLNLNYDLKDTPLHNSVLPYKIFNREGIKIGVTGVGIELQGLVDPKMYGHTRYSNPLQMLHNTERLLKKDLKCDLLICLSHLGYIYNDNKISDVVLAGESSYIDLIIGGHTHTFLDEPVSYKNKSGKKVLVAQVGWAGIRLGRVDFYFDVRSRKKEAIGCSVKISEKTSAV